MKKIIYIALFSIAVMMCAVKPSNAATQSQSPSAALRVSPVIINVLLIPGKQYIYPVSIENISENPMPVQFSFDTFSSDDSGDDLTFSQKSDNSLIPWSKVEPLDAIIPAHTKKIVQVTVTLPSKIPLGGYYQVLFVEPVQKSLVSGASVSAKVGVLFLANIGIDDKKNLIEVVRSSFDKGIYNTGPVTQSFQIQNNSLNHLTIKPRLIVQPLFGIKKTYWFEDKIIFPGKMRAWKQTFDLSDYHHFIYTTDLIVSRGNGNEVHSPGFLIAFPVLLVSGLLIIVVVGIFLYLRRRHLKRALRILISGK